MILTQQIIEKFWQRVSKTNTCWVWNGYKTSTGYGKLSIRSSKVVNTYYAHRISYLLHYGEMNNLQVLHRCDNPSCVNPSHLFLGTVQDNIQDCISKKRKPKGENASNAKFNNHQVREIRSLYESGKSIYSLAKKNQVSRYTFFSMVNFITYNND